MGLIIVLTPLSYDGDIYGNVYKVLSTWCETMSSIHIRYYCLLIYPLNPRPELGKHIST